MTSEEEIAALRARFSILRDFWRAEVGRLPRGYEARFMRIVEVYGYHRTWRAVRTVAASDLRRTKDRWRLFLALFGEAP